MTRAAYQQALDAELPAATERMLVADMVPAEPVRASADWIAADGLECPVSDLAKVQPWFRIDRDQRAAERANQGSGGVPAYQLEGWIHDGSDIDVLFYRVVA